MTYNANPVPSADATPEILVVGGYDDLGSGSRNGRVDPGSSRGARAHPTTWPDVSAPSVHVTSAGRAYHDLRCRRH
jgi:serine protease AprX